MSNSKTYMIVGGIAAFVIVSLIVAWWMGWFSSKTNSSSSTSSTEAAKLADEKIGEFKIDELRATADKDLDAAIFKELVYSIKSCISASDDLIKKIAVEFTKESNEGKSEEEKKTETDNKVKSVKEKMDKFKTEVFKSKDDFKTNYETFNKLKLSKEGDKLKVAPLSKENEEFLAKYKSILGEISSADTYKMDSDLKSAITTDKYEYTIESEAKKISAFNAIGFGFVTALIA